MNEKLTKILIEKQDNKPHGLGIYLFIYYWDGGWGIAYIKDVFYLV